MTKKNHVSKFALVGSVVALVLCFAMLFGTTYAWFSDREQSGRNRIVGGNLDIVLEYQNAQGQWVAVGAADELFSRDLWEPGHTEYAVLRIRNVGTLALHYRLLAYAYEEQGSVNQAGEQFLISNALKYGVVDDFEAFAGADEAAQRAAAVAVCTNNFPFATEADTNGNAGNQVTGVLYPAGSTAGDASIAFGLVITMPTETGNDYNYMTGVEAPWIDIGVLVEATQTPYENDSFGPNYDENANGDPDNTQFPEWPEVNVINVSTVDELLAALADAQPRNTIKLTDDIELTNQLHITNDVTIDGGTHTLSSTVGNAYAIQVDAGAKLTINGGTFDFGLYGIQPVGDLVINGGTFNGVDTDYIIAPFGGNVTVNGGTFNYGYCAINNLAEYYSLSDSVVTINGGTFVMDPNADTAWGNYPLLGGPIVITGGTFDVDPIVAAAGTDAMNITGTGYTVAP